MVSNKKREVGYRKMTGKTINRKAPLLLRMTTFLVILLSVLSNNANAQRGKDSLAKYSYMIYGSYFNGRDSVTVTGTVFFIKKGAKTYLVSAKHVLSGWDVKNGSRSDHYPDIMYIRMEKEGKTHFCPVDIKSIKQKSNGGFYYTDSDVVVMEFKEADNFQINSIEHLVSKKIPAKAQRVMVHGYPVHDASNYRYRGFSSMTASIASNPEEVVYYKDTETGIMVKDSINYAIMPNANVKSGFSGAPVFLFRNGNWVFGGLVSMYFQSDNYVTVVKPSIIMKQVNRRGRGI